jgi:hypothetical protein
MLHSCGNSDDEPAFIITSKAQQQRTNYGISSGHTGSNFQICSLPTGRSAGLMPKSRKMSSFGDMIGTHVQRLTKNPGWHFRASMNKNY